MRRGPSARPGRSRRVTPIVEMFNLFNADVISAVNTGYFNVNSTTSTLTPNAAFGTPTASVGERIIQLAVKFSF